MAAFEIDIDTKYVEKAAAALLKLDAQSLGKAAQDAVNKTAENAYELVRERMISGINLTDSYLQSQMRLDMARDPNSPQASIVARRKGVPGTTLTTYGAQVSAVPVRWTNERIAEAGHAFGPWPGWTQRKGDLKRGIQVGQKAAGFNVAVKRGAPMHFVNAFVIPKSGRLLTVTKVQGTDKIRALYGPAPWQLFRATIPHIYTQVEEDLRAAVDFEIGELLGDFL